MLLLWGKGRQETGRQAPGFGRQDIKSQKVPHLSPKWLEWGFSESRKPEAYFRLSIHPCKISTAAIRSTA
jgi:hypothetical protein